MTNSRVHLPMLVLLIAALACNFAEPRPDPLIGSTSDPNSIEGTYSCRDCVLPTWTEISAVAEAPRRMGDSAISLSIAEDGTVTGGNIKLVVYGTSPKDACFIVRHVFHAEEAVGFVDPETKDVTVDFLNGTESYERGEGQCEDLQVFAVPARRFYFGLEFPGDLMLCSEKGRECRLAQLIRED